MNWLSISTTSFALLLIQLGSKLHPTSAQVSIAGCANLITELGFNFNLFDRYDEFFREDSVMILAQAGKYKGFDGIREYIEFFQAYASPYLAQDTIEDYAFQFKGVDSDGLCETLTFHRNDYIFNKTTAAYAAEVGVSYMTKIFYDPVENYIAKIHLYYSEPFLEFFFGTMLDSEPTIQFLCEEVLQKTCNNDVPSCQEQMEALPALTPHNGYADGNSVGCRALHGAFASTNPEGHCAHISLEPQLDPNGEIKCQESKNISISDLFTEQDLKDYEATVIQFGINGTVGYVEDDPYYRSFQRIYEDTLQRIPTITNLLSTLAVPGVAFDAYSGGPICPAFQNDTTYWPDFAEIEMSETHLDWAQTRRLPQDGVFGDTVLGPGTCTVSYVSTVDIRKKLSEMPRRLQDGTAYRTNELGKNRLNTKTFEEGLWSDGYVGQFIGAPNADHSVYRPVMDYLFGEDYGAGEELSPFADIGNRWIYSDLVESAKDFLQAKNRIQAGVDPGIWVLKMLHKIALDEDKSDAQMTAFKDFMEVAVVFAFLPEESVDTVTASVGIDIELGLIWKRGNVDEIEEIMSSSPTFALVQKLVGDDPIALKKVSWAIFESFLFAGGLSVPSTILNAMASYYEGFKGKEELDLKDPMNLKLLVLETIRRYPPVSSVPIMDARDHHRSLPFIAVAGYDESVYGENVKDFEVRGDLQWYHQRSLQFGEPAVPVDEESPETARYCPGRSLAVAMAAAWLEALDLTEWCVSSETPLKRVPLDFAGYDLVRSGSENASCAVQEDTTKDSTTSGSVVSSPVAFTVVSLAALVSLFFTA